MPIETLNDIKDRCRLEGDCWIWAGGQSGGVPRLWAADLGDGGNMKSLPGRRVVWQLRYGKALPAGWRAYTTCNDPMCLNPAHVEALTPAMRGEKVAAAGTMKGLTHRIVANRKTNRTRSKLTQDLYDEIRTSDRPGTEFTAEKGISRTTISRIRTGKPSAFAPVGGPFSGLIA